MGDSSSTELVQQPSPALDRELAVQLELREALGINALPAFASLLSTYRWEPLSIRRIIQWIGVHVWEAVDQYTRFHLGSGGFLNDTFENFVQKVISKYSTWLTIKLGRGPDPWFDEPCEIDIRSVMLLLLHDAGNLVMGGNMPYLIRETRNEVFIGGLEWSLLRKTFAAMREVAQSCGSDCAQEYDRYLGEFQLLPLLEPDAEPVLGWTWLRDRHPPEEEDLLEAFDTSESVEPSESDEGEFENDLELNQGWDDQVHEPTGPDLKIEDHTLAVARTSELHEEDCSICCETLNVSERVRKLVPIKTECGHCFHYGCLSELINGIYEFSNLCPFCRAEICPKRQQCLKKEYRTSGESTSDNSRSEQDNEAISTRDLQDGSGDVVMTDA
ncbi:hypothetical protein T440DRAFT_521732 [Plenodomus tracheiphilus IPT5]|uniref:RING-type domain-containing protein n=1 Tax=Plenodomus tracheiphilus IPT5 TaxID=1408161 RepID=A0A6A7AUT6_9PLEO|nr:hypothetical protein T440DRAFT_521732 [Plenodomus tracheiphilus IPT5]